MRHSRSRTGGAGRRAAGRRMRHGYEARTARPGGAGGGQTAIGEKRGPAAEASSRPHASTLDARRSTLDARRSTLDARRSTLDARRSTLDARRSTLDARRSTLDARRSTLDARRSTLDARRSTIQVEAAIRECQALFDGGGAWPGDAACDGGCWFHGLFLRQKPALGSGRGHAGERGHLARRGFRLAGWQPALPGMGTAAMMAASQPLKPVIRQGQDHSPTPSQAPARFFAVQAPSVVVNRCNPPTPLSGGLLESRVGYSGLSTIPPLTRGQKEGKVQDTRSPVKTLDPVTHSGTRYTLSMA